MKKDEKLLTDDQLNLVTGGESREGQETAEDLPDRIIVHSCGVPGKYRRKENNRCFFWCPACECEFEYRQ